MSQSRILSPTIVVAAALLASCLRDVDKFDSRGKTPLMWAAQGGDTAQVLRLLAAGANVNDQVPPRDVREFMSNVRGLVVPRSEPGFTPLMYAAKGGRVHVVRILLDRGANAKHVADYGETALGYALDHSDVRMARLLTARGARLDARRFAGVVAKSPPEMVQLLLQRGSNPNGFAPADQQRGRPWPVPLLTAATIRGDPGVVKALIDAGARLNARDRNGWTALRWARDAETQRERPRAAEIVALLEAAGARDEVGSKAEALFDAVKKKDVARLRAALRAGANPNARDKRGVTPLIHAAYDGAAEIVTELAASGALVNFIPNNFAPTPLTAAIEYGSVETVKALLAAGAKPDFRDGRGWSPLFVATTHQRSPIAVLLLSDSSVALDKDNWAMNSASEMGDTIVVRLLIEHGADVNASNALRSAVYGCRRADNAPMVRLLLRNGAKTATTRDEPLLAVAGERCSAETVGLLLQHGANPNEKNWRGEPAIMVAAGSGKLENVKTLIAAGADLNVRDDVNRTLEQRAWRHPLVKQEIRRARTRDSTLHLSNRRQE